MGETAEAYQEAPLTPEEEIAHLHSRIVNLREMLVKARHVERRYNRLKRLELFVMEKEGAKYLRGDELDAYVDALLPELYAGPQA